MPCFLVPNCAHLVAADSLVISNLHSCTLDVRGPNDSCCDHVTRFLKADYRILVKPLGGPYNRTYLHYFVPGVVFMVIFAFVVPAAYFFILYFLRHRLQVRLTHMQPISHDCNGNTQAGWPVVPG